MNFLQCLPAVGERVRVRRERWAVASVQLHADCALVTLAGIGPGNALSERRIIAPFEAVEPLRIASHPRLVTRRRWRRLCRAHLAQNLGAGSLRTAARASIELLPHQLEPALAILRGLGSRVLLADDVGLGKTVQAGLIVAELEARGAVERVLVLTPAGLREQWATELATRFQLQPVLVDMAEAKRRAAVVPPDVNPWSTVPLAITSLDYAKRPEVLPSLVAGRWDLVLVDEAHNITEGTERFEAVHTIARLAPYVVLLTATPHNGDRRAFASLCSAGALVPDNQPLLIFRRRRHEVGLGTTRHVHRLVVRPSEGERLMHDLLARFIRAVRRERGSENGDARLALMVLHKRSLSSARSVARTVERRLSLLGSRAQPEIRQLTLPLDDDGGELDLADEAPALVMPLLDDEDRERHFLTAIKKAAEAASLGESKIARLSGLLRRLHRRGHRAIVFTEYRDTLMHLHDRLPFEAAVLHGGLTRRDRREALQDFVEGRAPLLLATDAAGEGLNLQAHCRIVINLELPWSPTRLEQRIGRVDRIGQRRTVHVWHLLAGDTGEMRLLGRLRARLADARSEFDVADPLTSAAASEVHAERAFPPLASVVRLSAEARIECASLARARRLLKVGDDEALRAAPPGAAVVTARNALRRWLGGRVLMLLRSSVEDGFGRTVGTHLTSLLVPFDAGGLHAVSGALDSARAGTLREWDKSLHQWELDTGRLHREFWVARLAREDAILDALRARPVRTVQPGLFDNRVEREGAVSSAEESRAVAEALRRRALAVRASEVHEARLEPVLALLPASSISG